jgi:hypothetical protein
MNIITTANHYNMFYMKSQHSIYLIFSKKQVRLKKKGEPALKKSNTKKMI